MQIKSRVVKSISNTFKHIHITYTFAEIIASKSCKPGEWVDLLSIEDAGLSTSVPSKIWIIPAEKQDKFSCVGFRVWTSVGKPNVSLNDVVMWEEITEIGWMPYL